MADKKLRPKYVVFRIDEEKAEELQQGHMPSVSSSSMLATDSDDIDAPFVLMPRKDPAALYAMMHYAQMCETDLANEINVWLGKIIESSPVYGTQGARNRIAIRSRQLDSV